MSKVARDRAAAKRIVEEQKAKARRRRMALLTSAAVVVVLAAAALIGWAVVRAQDADQAGKLIWPTAVVDDRTAVAVGSGPVVIDVYEDFMCPICGKFEQEAGPTLKQLVEQKKVTVRYHPIAILDDASNGKRYSTRSAGAAAAANMGGEFMEFHDALFANQPEEGSDGLDDARLIELGRAAGLGDDFADAVKRHTYSSWAAKVTETASARGIRGTPTILMGGTVTTEPNGAPPSAATILKVVAGITP